MKSGTLRKAGGPSHMPDSWNAKRKETRILLTIPVVLEGSDDGNVAFREETVTENVSKSGACIIVDRILRLGSIVTVSALQGKFKCQGEVRAIWVDDHDRRKKAGVRFTQPTTNWVVS